MILDCKVCGGSLKIIEGSSICKCEYCGKEQTFPKTDDAQTLNMLNRANHFRNIFEFDKAIEIYERLLNNGNEDAEVYWSLALCRYGIEYVDDPKTMEKIPTCHRTQYSSILVDADYLMAIENADSIQKNLYEREAHYIDQVQKEILEISNKEEPFDIFICYKENDGVGNRTKDSVLAQDIYYQLTAKGYKVFFSRITLENKLGQQYEPYIFAALNSAKVMIVVGTKPEYYSAVWVKNEWNRFLTISRDDKSRLIIPAYKDMDPYDLPDALSYFQALDMSKIGFVQDLVRGIDKVLKDDRNVKPETTNEDVANGFKGNIIALLKRGNYALEDAEWNKAFTYYDQVLNLNAENGEAYLGLALVEMKFTSLEELIHNRISLFNDNLAKFPEVKIVRIEEEKINQWRTLLEKENLMGFNLSNYQEEYKTSVTNIEKYIETERMFFENNKNLQKGMRFSEEVKKSVKEAEDIIYSEMQKSLESAKNEESASIQEARHKINEFYESRWAAAIKKIQDRESKYDELKNRYISTGGNVRPNELLREFKKYAGYKDANEIIHKLDSIIEKRISELEKEHEIVEHAISNIKGFTKKKRQQQESMLQNELQQIMAEIVSLRK